MLNFYLYLICFSLSFLLSLFITESQLWSLQTWNFQDWFLLTCLSAYIIYSLFQLMNNLFPNSSYVGRKFFLVLLFHLALDYITVSLVSFQIITHISWFRLRKRTGIAQSLVRFFHFNFLSSNLLFPFPRPHLTIWCTCLKTNPFTSQTFYSMVFILFSHPNSFIFLILSGSAT